jgi:hypothetical protein
VTENSTVAAKKPVRISLLEIAIVVSIIGVLSLLIVPELGSSWSAEWKASRWKPSEFDQATPQGEFLAPNAVLDGWWSRRGMAGVSMRFSDLGDGIYKVDFETSGCCNRWRLERTAERNGATIVFDKPVVEYAPLIYDRVHLVRHGGFDFLVPGCEVSGIEKILTQSVSEGSRPSWCLMRRSDQEAYWAACDARLSEVADEGIDPSP